MELLQLKHDSDVLDDASSPAIEIAAAVTVTASVEHLHAPDGDADIPDNAIDSSTNRRD